MSKLWAQRAETARWPAAHYLRVAAMAVLLVAALFAVLYMVGGEQIRSATAHIRGTVYTRNNYFSPSTITVYRHRDCAGCQLHAAVRWVNNSTRAHTVTSTSSNWIKNTTVYSGGSTRFRFTRTGTYYYTCVFHSGMNGKVIVRDS